MLICGALKRFHLCEVPKRTKKKKIMFSTLFQIRQQGLMKTVFVDS